MAEATFLKRAALLPHGLTLFSKVGQDQVIIALRKLLESLASPHPFIQEIFRSYHYFCSLAWDCGWPGYVLDLILDDENQFSRQAGAGGLKAVDPALAGLAARDLSTLERLAGITARQIKDFACQILLGAVSPDASSAHKSLPAGISGAEVGELAGTDRALDPFDPRTWAEWPSQFKLDRNPTTPSQYLPAGSGAASWLQACRREVKLAMTGANNWQSALCELSRYYQEVGWGLFSRFVAFRWQAEEQSTGRADGPGRGRLNGIANPDPICLDDLVGLTDEHQAILENTEHFLDGYPANNILLYGDRGTGKSSTVKALLNRYASRGLRLVELAKADLLDLPGLARQLAVRPQKFLVFIDDLAFDDADPSYRAAKTALEGGLEDQPSNLLIYATSNRKNLVRETFGERQGGEVRVQDSLQEKLSLVDRFGVVVTFASPSQEAYLGIVEALAERRKLNLDRYRLRQQALQWQMWHNGRSGRSARQLVDYLEARIRSGEPLEMVQP